MGMMPEQVRQRFAQALSDELGVDLSPTFMQTVDRILTRLYLLGLIVGPDQ